MLHVIEELDREDHIKDLGVIFDEHLDFGMHIAERINKAYSMLWLIKRNIKDTGRDVFLILYKHLVRSHLEYCNFVWAPYKKSYIDKLENVQKRATKMIPELRTRGQSNLTKSTSRGAHSPARGHPRGSKVVPLNSWGRVSY